MATGRSHLVSRAWRWISLGLGVLLLSSWAFLAYSVLDCAISLDYCRVEQRHQERTIRVLIDASVGSLPSSALLDAIVKDSPELEGIGLEGGNTLPYGGATLVFDSEGILAGSVASEEAAGTESP